MEYVKNEDNKYTINFSKDELYIINNALNEVCNGIDLFEFDSRLGTTIDEVKALLKDINSVL